VTLPAITVEMTASTTGVDPYVSTLAAQLLACLCAEVQNQPNPPTHCCYRVGTEVSYDAGLWVDMCCEGIAYVTMGDSFPSNSFPDNDVNRQASAQCSPPSWGQIFKAGIIRCAPTGTDTSPPTCDDWNAAFSQNIADALTLRRVQCCIRDWVRTNEDQFLGMSVIMDRQVQGNPQGGCIERSFTVQIQFPNCDC
jgi:hypothetical protein